MFALDEPGHLGSALKHLIRDRAAARRMGAEGRARVVEQFSWKASTAAYLRLVDESPE